MYQDNPEWKVMMNLLEAMYVSHPINTDIAGTVDSIAEITPEILYECYNSYYNLHNMILCIAGDVDPEEVLAVADKKLKPAEITAKLQEAYAAGTKVVFSTVTEIPVKDTLFRSRPDFCIDSLYYIPFSGKQLTQMEATIKTVSGVQVPLFEARMPYKALCLGMDNQLRINKDAECRDQNKYEGLQVGSVTAPNNNAGNWE